MKKSVHQHCTSCQVYTKHNIKTQQLRNKHFSSPPQPMEFIAMDLIGEFHPTFSKGNKYALTAICMLTGFTFCIPLKSKKAEDVINTYINHICCPFGPSKKILTDNGTEFKNKLWTEVFDKLRTEQKFTPIYSPQCNGQIEGFYKFLKATIAKQLENRVEWDDLVWKATAAYNFFPTESSGIAPFFLMFRWEAAVKHTLLESESPKYLGTDDCMINIELVSKLYLVVVHNLNEARKARDGNKQKKNTRNPEQLKVGDNVLVRDHTSKAFQPKYKDFCIIGLLGKNRVEIKNNHGHTTKVHRRDVKKIPMTETVCQLYEEEQVGKVRNGKKAIPDSKMPDLGWDATEELEIQRKVIEPTEETNEIEDTVRILPETLISIVVLIVAFLDTIKSQLQEIPKISRKAAQAVTQVTRMISHNKLIKRASETYRKTVQAITDATRMTHRNSRPNPHRTANRNHHYMENLTVRRKLNGGYDRLYHLYSTTTPRDNYDQVFAIFHLNRSIITNPTIINNKIFCFRHKTSRKPNKLVVTPIKEPQMKVNDWYAQS